LVEALDNGWEYWPKVSVKLSWASKFLICCQSFNILKIARVSVSVRSRSRLILNSLLSRSPSLLKLLSYTFLPSKKKWFFAQSQPWKGATNLTFIRISFLLFACLSIYLFFLNLSVCLSIYLTLFPQSICCLSICLYISFLNLTGFLSVCLYVDLSIYLSFLNLSAFPFHASPTKNVIKAFESCFNEKNISCNFFRIYGIAFYFDVYASSVNCIE
jgi:hypothetical protein